jgi:hypothetical protein
VSSVGIHHGLELTLLCTVTKAAEKAAKKK